MTVGWECKQLGEVLRLEYGKPLPDENRAVAGRYAVYGANGEKARSNRFYHDKRSIIVGRKGSAGEINLTEEKFWPLDVTYFATFDETRHDLKFLYYLLDTLDLPSMARGVKPGINRNDVYALGVAIPPLPEQQTIVGILDAAFAGIAAAKANAEHNRQNARALFDGHRQAVLDRRDGSWAKTNLGAEIELLVGFAFKSAGYVNSDESTRLLRGDNIIQGSIRWDDAKRWPLEDCSAYQRFELRLGDVVLAMDRPWVKAGLKRAMISLDDLPLLLVQRTASLRCREKLDNRYLFHLISGNGFIRHLLGVQTGTGVPHISGQQIKDFEFARPSLSEQKRIADDLDALDAETQHLESLYTRKLAALAELKQSLLRQAFSGAL